MAAITASSTGADKESEFQRLQRVETLFKAFQANGGQQNGVHNSDTTNLSSRQNGKPDPSMSTNSEPQYSNPAPQTNTPIPDMSDDKFHPHAEADRPGSSHSDSNDNMTISREEQAERQQQLDAIASKTTAADRAQKLKLTPKILDLYKEGYTFVRLNWWEDRLNETDPVIDKINA